MRSAMAAVPFGFGCFPTNESSVLSSRIRGARLPCAGTSKVIYSSGIPSTTNRLHVFYQHHKTRYSFPNAMNVSAGQSDDHQKLGIYEFINVLKKLWDSSPQPVRNFPWTTAVMSFCQLIFELTRAVAKYLSIPLLAISSLSEESFPGHLLLIASFFLLIKLPGPHYPHWGRLIIPHFANGGLWKTACSVFMWCRKPQRVPGDALETLGVTEGNSPEDEK